MIFGQLSSHSCLWGTEGPKSFELRRQEKDERTQTKQKSYEDLRWINNFFKGTCGVFGVRFLSFSYKYTSCFL